MPPTMCGLENGLSRRPRTRAGDEFDALLPDGLATENMLLLAADDEFGRTDRRVVVVSSPR